MCGQNRFVAPARTENVIENRQFRQDDTRIRQFNHSIAGFLTGSVHADSGIKEGLPAGENRGTLGYLWVFVSDET